jgi:hypothetical protein
MDDGAGYVVQTDDVVFHCVVRADWFAFDRGGQMHVVVVGHMMRKIDTHPSISSKARASRLDVHRAHPRWFHQRRSNHRPANPFTPRAAA